MITYNSKIIKYLALVLFGFLIYQKYQENKAARVDNKFAVNNILGSEDAKYKIKIDGTKKYENFSLVEKFAYNSTKDKLPQYIRNKIEH